MSCCFFLLYFLDIQGLTILTGRFFRLRNDIPNSRAHNFLMGVVVSHPRGGRRHHPPPKDAGDDWRIHSHGEGLRVGLQFQETGIVELFIASFSQTPCLPSALSSKLFNAPFCFIFLFTDQLFFISNVIKKSNNFFNSNHPLVQLYLTFTFR